MQSNFLWGNQLNDVSLKDRESGWIPWNSSLKRIGFLCCQQSIICCFIKTKNHMLTCFELCRSSAGGSTTTQHQTREQIMQIRDYKILSFLHF